MTGRAAEIAVREAREGSHGSSEEGGKDESKEGSGERVVKGSEEDYGGRFTNEVVKTMHEVSLIEQLQQRERRAERPSAARAKKVGVGDGAARNTARTANARERSENAFGHRWIEDRCLRRGSPKEERRTRESGRRAADIALSEDQVLNASYGARDGSSCRILR